jgi:hypothetical protein
MGRHFTNSIKTDSKSTHFPFIIRIFTAFINDNYGWNET